MPEDRLPAFDKFIAELRDTWARHQEVGEAMEQCTSPLRTFITDRSVIEHAKTWPSTEGHKNLLFYEDPDHGFIINAVVRPGPRDTPSSFDAHDHATAWVLYGLVEGTETLQRYDRLDDGSIPGYAEIALRDAPVGGPGTIDLVPPFDPHTEVPGPRRSVAVIVRSERLVGRKLQGRYYMAEQRRGEGEGPTQVPYGLVPLPAEAAIV